MRTPSPRRDFSGQLVLGFPRGVALAALFVALVANCFGQSLPRACSVYLFDRIRISSGVQPLTTKSIQLLGNSNVATRLSLAEITTLPLDASGYHILKMPK
jgi:hypothetical protein